MAGKELKYEILEDGPTRDVAGHEVKRIRALKDFECQGRTVYAGDIGGWIESEANLKQDGTCWVAHEAVVCDKAFAAQNALVCDDAIVSGKAIIMGDALVEAFSTVKGHATIKNSAVITDRANVMGEALVTDYARVADKGVATGFAIIGDRAVVFGVARGTAKVVGTGVLTSDMIATDGLFGAPDDKDWLKDNLIEMGCSR